MKAIGVIPARFASSRFPGKPLALISGRPMLQWVVEAAQRSRRLEHLLVATDDQRIFDLAQSLAVDAVMTDRDCATGTDRVWQAVKDREASIVVNIQGDEPLLDPQILDRLVQIFDASSHENIQMATLGRRASAEDLNSLNTAKIVLNHRSEAIYFSRWAIPYSREPAPEGASGRDLGLSCLKHIGLYAYRRDFLRQYCAAGETALERCEGLEQLRALYLGARIKVVEVEAQSWGVDTPEDVQKIEAIIKSTVQK